MEARGRTRRHEWAAGRSARDRRRALLLRDDKERGAKDREPRKPFCAKNRTPCHGLKATRTEGYLTTPEIPRRPIARNQTSMVGPKTKPICFVPFVLEKKQQKKNRDRDRNDERPQRRGRDFQSF